MKLKTKYFLLGIITYACMNSLNQDLMGKEAWLARAREHWIDGSITIPLAIFGLCYVIYKMGKDDNDKVG